MNPKKSGRRVRAQIAMLVALDPMVRDQCADYLSRLGYGTLTVAHVPAAATRIGVVEPALVLISTSTRSQELGELNRACSEAGAHLVAIPTDSPTDVLKILARATACAAGR